MKNLLVFFSVVIFANSICYSQLPSSYPFKTAIDGNGYLYVTGDTFVQSNNNYDTFIKKFSGSDLQWKTTINAPEGNDKGLDITINIEGDPIITGHEFDNSTNSNDIFVAKLNSNSGNVIWYKTFSGFSEDKGFGVTTDFIGNVYVTGFTTNTSYNKDIVTLKYNSIGTFQWSRIYNNKNYKQEDVGTDILVDQSHVYVMGYTYNGELFQNDLILINYNLSGGNQEVDIFNKRVTNEIPTGFVITGKGLNNDKSKIALTSVSDNIADPNTGSSYLTVAYNGGVTMDYMWMSTFSRSPGEENIATSIDADKNGDVYVTGYCYTTEHEFDFATIKYYGDSGKYAWQNEPVLFYDMGNGNDKASSIKVFGDSIYVSGSSQFYPGGYRTIAYRQNNRNVEMTWDNVFIPSFLNDDRNLVNRASLVNIDTTNGSLSVMAMAWDNNLISKYAIIGYSGNGNILYKIDYDDPDSQSLYRDNVKTENTISTVLKQNYPNPFNPVSVIRYSLSENRFVRLRVYDILGNEVADLVKEKQNAGSYEAIFDGSKLSSGTYYYTMSIDGKIIDTKRMILLK